MLDGTTLQADLQWEEEGEEKLVVLVEPRARVMKDLKGQVLNDVLDLLIWDGVRVLPD